MVGWCGQQSIGATHSKPRVNGSGHAAAVIFEPGGGFFACGPCKLVIMSGLMRVAVAFGTADPCVVSGADRYDLRADPGAIERIEAARLYPALRSFLAHLNTEESLFTTFGSRVWSGQEEDAAGPCEWASRVDLIFAREAANFGREAHEDLARRLAALLERESGDALRAELRIAPAMFAGEKSGFCLRLILCAHGSTPEQAHVRWAFGLVRMQQALLFASRALRQELGEAS